MSRSWPESPEGPFNLTALQNGLRTGLEHRLVDHTQLFERFAKEQAKAAEEAALQRSEALLEPQVHALSIKMQKELDAINQELLGLMGRATAAEGRLESLESGAVADRKRSNEEAAAFHRMLEDQADKSLGYFTELRTEADRLAHDLVAAFDEAERKRVQLCAELRESISETSERASLARDQMRLQLQALLKEAECRLLERLDAGDERASALETQVRMARAEAIAEDNKLMLRLEQEKNTVATTTQTLQVQLVETQQQLELCCTSEAVRTQLQGVEATAAVAAKALERRLQSLAESTSESLELVRAQTQLAQEGHQRLIDETFAAFHVALAEARRSWGDEISTLDQQMNSRMADTEKRMLSAARQQVDAATGQVQEEVSVVTSAIAARLDLLRQELRHHSH